MFENMLFAIGMLSFCDLCSSTPSQSTHELFGLAFFMLFSVNS